MTTTYVTLREKYEVNVDRFKKKTHISLLVKFGLMKLTKLTNMSSVSKQSTSLEGIQREIPFNLGSLSSSLSVCVVVCGAVVLSIFPPTPIPYVSSFHCFISVTGAWNGGS